jgi:bifunctional non-homologous end joining protein LigD
MEGIVSKNVEAPPRGGTSLVEDHQVRAAGQVFPIVGFVKDPAGVAALHVARREWKDFVYVRKSRHRLQSKIINGNPQEA